MASKLARLLPCATALALAAAGGSSAASGQGRDAPVETIVQADVVVRGTVTAIDRDRRLVTLDTGTGTRVLPVALRVAELETLQVGDVVDVRYHRSILFDIQPAGTAEPGAYIAEEARDAGAATKVGQQEVTVIATVVEVDGAAGALTVQGPSDTVRTLYAETPEHREAVRQIKVGDLLRVRFREGLAVSLAPVELH